MSTVSAIWIHQFNRIAERNWDEIRARWPGPVYVKALDGLSFMSRFDKSPLAIDRPGGSWSEQPYTWTDMHAVPWTNPTAVDGNAEGLKTAVIAEQAGSIILDLEPYSGFWRGNHEDALQFCQAYDRGTTAPFAISLDYRRLPFPDLEFHNRASGYLPQCYWTTFERPWREVLEDCARALAPYEKPIEYVLPGNAFPEHFAAALDWVRGRGATAGVWLWQSINPENWETILADRDQPTEPEVPCPDLVNLLGYLQGDLAKAVQEPLEHILITSSLRLARREAQRALSALEVLQHAGE